jgi:hypothetical protein
LLFFVASWQSLGRGGHERVAEAFATSALSTDLWGNEVSGRHRFNDCLITALALEQRQPREKLTVSPVNPSEPLQDVCRDLRDGTGINHAAYYHNYLHGHAVLLRYLLPHWSIGAIKEGYKAGISLLLLAAIALCLARLFDASARREESLIFLIVLLGFARFFGLEWFAQSLGHGPSDLVVLGFVALLTARAGAMSRRGWVLSAALFGALTMIFEFLTGGLPLGASVVLGLGWFALAERERSPTTVVLGLVAYGIGAAVPLLVKLALVASLFGSKAVSWMAMQGIFRMGSELPPGLEGVTATSQLLLNINVLAPGLPLFSAGLLVLALALGLVAALRHPQPPFLLLLASILPIILWFLAFRQHTAIHAWFMARILVWPLIAGFALFALAAMRAGRAASSGKAELA